MKKHKTGFTLAEVLVTLTIIGVVAAITIPSLNINVQKAQAAPSLMKAINTLQNALSLGITQKGLRNLNSFTITKEVFENSSKGPLYATLDYYDPTTETVDYYNADNTLSTELSTNIRVYTLKDGTDFILPNAGTNAVNEIKNMQLYGKQGFSVYVDVNGFAKAPNRLGKDTFKLIVDTKGFIIPYGGYEYAKYSTNVEEGGEDTPIVALWETTCNSEIVTDGAACTGSIVDHNGKVTYRY